QTRAQPDDAVPAVARAGAKAGGGEHAEASCSGRPCATRALSGPPDGEWWERRKRRKRGCALLEIEHFVERVDGRNLLRGKRVRLAQARLDEERARMSCALVADDACDSLARRRLAELEALAMREPVVDDVATAFEQALARSR